MKVVLVGPYYIPLTVGGFQIQINNIFKELKNMGVNVQWFSFEENVIKDADIIQVMSPNASMLPLLRFAKIWGSKIVITPMQGSRLMSNTYLKAALALSKIPQLCTSHKTNAAVLSMADYLTPLCGFEAVRMNQVYSFDRDKIKVIPNGIDYDFLSKDAIPVDLPFKDYILMVGRIDPNKNQFMMINVAKRLGKNLLIVGEPGSGGPAYYEKCKAAAGDNVYFWGLEKNPLVLKYMYQNAAVTAIPSFSEMLPLVAFESLSQKTPVVCTNRCGISDDIIPGLFFSKIIEKDLTENIISACEYAPSNITDAGVYTWRQIAEMYVEVYNQLLNK